MIKDEDFETPLPNIDPVGPFFVIVVSFVLDLNNLQDEDRRPWQPTLTKDNLPYPPVPGHIISTFCAISRLGESYCHFQ
jgi:hypothetical protein